MKKRVGALFLACSMVLSLVLPVSADTPEEYKHAVYLGLETFSSETENFVHQFNVDGTVVGYKIQPDGEKYEIQNHLMEGYVYDFTVENGVITAAAQTQAAAQGAIALTDDAKHILVGETQVTVADDTKIYQIDIQPGGASAVPATLTAGETCKVYGDPAEVIYLTTVTQPHQAPVSGIPGQRTLKNFFATALEPAGTTLYVYGGTWDWQDVASSRQSMTIGISQDWVDFFASQDGTYDYETRDTSSPYGFNQYYYAGIDCSGYVAWTMYNIMNTQDGQKGYVMSASKMARYFAETEGFGTWQHARPATPSDFKPGDIFSTDGHVWICVGVCDDDSLVILHSTPSKSKAGFDGGGVQLSGVGPAGSEAHQLAQQYMSKYYPAWSERYDAVDKNYDTYTTFTRDNSGHFTWNLDATGVTDPDGYATMSAAEILADLFGEPKPVSSSFSDVPSSSPYASAVNYAAQHHYMVGTGEGIFAPETAVNRAMLAQTLYNVDGAASQNSTAAFSDVATDAWYANAVAWAHETGLVSGVGDGLFAPESNLTWEQVVVIFCHYAQQKGLQATQTDDLSAYPDTDDTSAWAQEAMAWATSCGLLDNIDNVTPKAIVTRGALAQLLLSFSELN